MAQLTIACRDYIEDGECSIVLGADTLEEVLEAAIEHAYATHAQEDTPALRACIKENVQRAALA